MTADEIARVLVKGLVWEETAVVPGYWRARVDGLGAYEIYRLGDSRFALDRLDVRGGIIVGRFPTLAAAQAAAEADYRARIAAALNLDLVAQLVEAAAGVLEDQKLGHAAIRNSTSYPLHLSLTPFREAP